MRVWWFEITRNHRNHWFSPPGIGGLDCWKRSETTSNRFSWISRWTLKKITLKFFDFFLSKNYVEKYIFFSFFLGSQKIKIFENPLRIFKKVDFSKGFLRKKSKYFPMFFKIIFFRQEKMKIFRWFFFQIISTNSGESIGSDFRAFPAI